MDDALVGADALGKHRLQSLPVQHVEEMDGQEDLPIGPAAQRWRRVSLMGLLISFIWSYWPTFLELSRRWSSDPGYSHGYLVPFFSIYLLWLRRDRIRSITLRTSWWGLPLLLVGIAVRAYGAYYSIDWFDAISLLPSLAGACLLLGGWPALGWSWPAILFLFFMIPLPDRAQAWFASYRYRRFATLSGAYGLRMLGLPAVADGIQLVLGKTRIGIVPECAGLRTLIVFLALSTAVALLIDRAFWIRVFLVISSIPIALLVNIVRIMLIAILYDSVDQTADKEIYHHLAGWLVMPMAVGLLWLELKLVGWALPTNSKRADKDAPQRRTDTEEIKMAFGFWLLALGSWALRRTRAKSQKPKAKSQKPKAKSQKPKAKSQSRWSIPTLLTFLLILVSGLVHGHWSFRWSDAGELRMAAQRLGRVPKTIGRWQGEERSANEFLAKLPVADYIFRRYVHQSTGQAVTMLLVCGRPGAVTTLPVGACLPPNRYQRVAEPIRYFLEYDSGSAAAMTAEFQTARFRGEFQPTSSERRIFWTYRATDSWQAPDHHRFHYARSGVLFELLLVQGTSASRWSQQGEPCIEFARELLPELERTVFEQ